MKPNTLPQALDFCMVLEKRAVKENLPLVDILIKMAVEYDCDVEDLGVLCKASPSLMDKIRAEFEELGMMRRSSTFTLVV